MIALNQKCCLLLTGVSTESKTYLCTSDKADFLATRSMTRIKSKNLQITSKLLTQGNRYHTLRKTFGKSFRSYSEFLYKFGEITFQEYVSERISHPIFYGDLVYKLRRVKCETNFVSSGSTIVKRLRRWKYDPVINKRTIGLGLFHSLVHYDLQAVGLYDGTCPNLLRGDKALILFSSDC